MNLGYKNIITSNIVVAFVVGMAAFGYFKYSEERLAMVEVQMQEYNKKLLTLTKNYKKDIADLNTKVSGATSLADVIAEEQTKNNSTNNSLKEEFGRIASKINDLTKLSTTDKELLKKYSKNYFLNEHYIPISLSPVDVKYVSKTSGNFQIHSNVLPYLQTMLIAAEGEGLKIKVQSAYRSFASQANLKSTNAVVYGVGTANKFSADQGYSEHQLGTTIDFSTDSLGGKLPGFDKTPEYTWLTNNAYRFGFVLSYPKGNSYYIYEPWHWRFVGIALATRLHNENLYFYDLDQRIIDTYLIHMFD